MEPTEAKPSPPPPPVQPVPVQTVLPGAPAVPKPKPTPKAKAEPAATNPSTGPAPSTSPSLPGTAIASIASPKVDFVLSEGKLLATSHESSNKRIPREAVLAKWVGGGAFQRSAEPLPNTIPYNLAMKGMVFDLGHQKLCTLEDAIVANNAKQAHGYKPVVAGAKKIEVEGRAILRLFCRLLHTFVTDVADILSLILSNAKCQVPVTEFEFACLGLPGLLL